MQKPLRKPVGIEALYVNPADGANSLMAGANEQEKPETYRTITTYWAINDPVAAAEWLKQQPQGPELDLARVQFANTVANKDPAAAMEWAKDIRNEAQQFSEVGRVFRKWHARDPAAADAALDAAELPPERHRQLKAEAAAARGGARPD